MIQKIQELLALFGIEGRLVSESMVPNAADIDFDMVHSRIATEREKSIEVLKSMLNI